MMMNNKKVSDAIIEISKTLKLNRFREYKEYLKDNTSFEEMLHSLLLDELEIKENNKYKARIRNAAFPYIKTLDTYKFDEIRLPNLKQDTILKLSNCDFIKDKSNIIAVGNSGTGKTHIAIALGIEAIQKGYTVKFRRASDIVNQMSEAQNDKILSKFLKTLNTCDCLIVDELGFLSFDVQSANLLFQVFAYRYELKSTIVTSNLEFSKWIKILGNDETMASALVERLLFRSTVLNMNGKGYRIK
jgi:DNA replication protein DnaC